MSDEISENDVYKIAKLANLSLSKDEAIRYAKDLSSILAYMEKLDQIDISQVEPMSHVQSLYGSAGEASAQGNVFREDVVKPSISVDDALRNAPARNGPFFKTPLIKESEAE